MPYNLRKRKAPEPVEELEPKKPRARVTKVAKTTKAKETKEVKKVKTVKEVKEAKEVEEANEVNEVNEANEVKEVKKVKEVKVSKRSKKSKVLEDSKEVQEDKEIEVKADTAVKESEQDKQAGENQVEEVRKVKKAKKETEKTTEHNEAQEPPIAEPVEGLSNLYVFGEDSCGEFGLGKIGVVKNNPTQVPLKFRIKQVACGPMHTVALTTDGHVYTFGCNDEGALGRITEEEEEEATPTMIQLDDTIIKVTAGDSHSAALSESNKVYIWGNFKDEHGSVGLLPECDGEKSYRPMQVMSEVKFKDIASGSNHMLLLDIDGVVYSFGVGAQGQLGRLAPEDLGPNENETHAISAKNRDQFLKPQPVSFKYVDPQRTFICDAIYAGNYTSFATNTDKKKNRLAGWGLNNYHQLGYKGTKQQLKQHFPRRSTFTCSTSMVGVACGSHHTLFLTRTGRVFAAGKSLYGMLGLGNISAESVCPAKPVEGFPSSVKTIATNSSASFAATDDGKLYSWGMSGPCLGAGKDEDLLRPTEVTRLKGKEVISISSGSTFTAVLVQ